MSFELWNKDTEICIHGFSGNKYFLFAINFEILRIIIVSKILPVSVLFSTVHSAVVFSNENSTIHIDAVVDPLSPSGQKLSSILQVLQKYIQPSMRIVLNPLVS